MNHSLTTRNHVPHSWTYADAAARTAATGFITSDLYKLARQADDNSLWLLIATSPTWVQIAGASNFATYSRRTVSGTGTQVSGDDVVFLDATSASFTFTLLSAAARTRPLWLKVISTNANTVTIDGNASETIDGTTTVSLAAGDRICIIPRTSSAWETI